MARLKCDLELEKRARVAWRRKLEQGSRARFRQMIEEVFYAGKLRETYIRRPDSLLNHRRKGVAEPTNHRIDGLPA